MTTSATPQDDGTTLEKNLFGLCFALSSSLFIGTGFILNKISTERIVKGSSASPEKQSQTTPLQASSSTSSTKYTLRDRAASSSANTEKLGFKFLLSPLWWLYILCTALGEGSNFLAYLFAPATLVAPLGALSMVVTCILSGRFLNERMDIVSKLGVVLAILGAIFVILNAPADADIQSIDQLINDYFYQTPFLVYAVLNSMAIAGFFLMRKRHFFYRVLVASLASAFVVIGSKSIGISATGAFRPPKNVTVTTGNMTEIELRAGGGGIVELLGNPVFFVLLVALVGGMIINIIQVTMALNMADASTVIPIHYVCFTSSVIFGMNVLFQEYRSMEWRQLISVFAGFGVLVIAVFLIKMFKSNSQEETVDKTNDTTRSTLAVD